MKLSRKSVIGFSIFMILMIGEVNAQQQPLPQRALMVGTKEAPPFSMKAPDGNWTGISIDLWQQIAAELDLTYEWRELDLKQLLEGVKNRSLDAAVAALTITAEREKNFDFTHATIRQASELPSPRRPAIPGLRFSDGFCPLHF